jgi:hypothetical protein
MHKQNQLPQSGGFADVNQGSKNFRVTCQKAAALMPDGRGAPFGAIYSLRGSRGLKLKEKCHCYESPLLPQDAQVMSPCNILISFLTGVS